jgi:hypothetical protein
VTQNTDDKLLAVRQLLHQVAETHHVVFAISDGDDPDWASWYADWLVNLSALPRIVGVRPVRSELTWLLVGLDREFMRHKPAEAWEEFYAERLVTHFATRR